MSEPYIASSTGCPACGAQAEPEEEDGVRKLACTGCGYEFGHAQVPQQDESACSLGIPESTRRAFSFPDITGRSIDIPFPADQLTDEGRTFLGLPTRRTE